MNWEENFYKEINLAIKAREEGNEGKARVCARRAAGQVIGEFLRRNGYPKEKSSVYARLQYLLALKNISPRAREAAYHLLLKITPEHTLPVDVDLIEEANFLKNYLIDGKESD